MATLEKAIEIATRVHDGQIRFDGSPYITHPLRVKDILTLLGYSLDTQITGVLHDTVEDGEDTVSLESLARDGFGEGIITPLELLTKAPGEDYDLYIQRLAPNPRARAVKKVDLFVNTDLTGLENPSLKQIMNVEKYGRSLVYLARFPQPIV